MKGELPEEWENSIIIPTHKKRDKPKVETYSGVNLLNVCYELHSNTVNDKLRAQAELFLMECQKVFLKDRSGVYPLF